MIEYYSVRDKDDNEVIAFDTRDEALEYVYDNDLELEIVKVIM